MSDVSTNAKLSMPDRHHHIDGKWHAWDGSDVIEIRSPDQRGHMATVSKGGPSAVDAAIQADDKALDDWSDGGTRYG